MKTEFINYGKNTEIHDRNCFKVAQVDEFGHPLVWYDAYWDCKGFFRLYPRKVQVPGAVKNVGYKELPMRSLRRSLNKIFE